MCFLKHNRAEEPIYLFFRLDWTAAPIDIASRPKDNARRLPLIIAHLLPRIHLNQSSISIFSFPITQNEPTMTTPRDISSSSKRQRLAVVVTLSAAALPSLPFCSAFGVVERAQPRSMENLVLGTVALPFVPGDPMQLLDDAYERGFYRFDLARTYGAGKSEKVFGKWLAESGVDRSSVHLVTKGGMGNDKYGNPGEFSSCAAQFVLHE